MSRNQELNKSIIQVLREQKILPLFYHHNRERCVTVTAALYAAGIRCVEFTNRGDAAVANFNYIMKNRAALYPNMLIGAGTIQSTADVDAFVNAGADFLISPYFDAAVCERAENSEQLWIPGCMTPTEIHTASQNGCSVVKLFPGNVLENNFVSAVKPVFPHMEFIVTGGVELEASGIFKWLQQGVLAAGLGSNFLNKDLLENGRPGNIAATTKQLLEDINTQIKNSKSF